MHGGLTAAIIDEAFGFLMVSLRSNRQLPFIGPAFTAHLEVEYKAKIQAGRLLLCTTEVESIEGRKLWMKATVRDGPTGKVRLQCLLLSFLLCQWMQLRMPEVSQSDT